MVQINWTNQAAKDLKNIYDFIAADLEYYAQRQIVKIKLRTELIRTHIRIGRMVPEFENELIREVIEKQYRIVYKIVNVDEVDIITVHHSSRENIMLKE